MDLTLYTDKAKGMLDSASAGARDRDHESVGTDDLLLAIAATDSIGGRSLSMAGFDLGRFEASSTSSESSDAEPRPFTLRATRALDAAARQSTKWGHQYIGTEHVLIGLLSSSDSSASELLTKQGITADAVAELVRQWVRWMAIPTKE
jgi:ATP-dependent Clp protease ATP-binding subunit ClpC